jgi:hypothetical protein
VTQTNFPSSRSENYVFYADNNNEEKMPGENIEAAGLDPAKRINVAGNCSLQTVESLAGHVSANRKFGDPADEFESPYFLRVVVSSI